MLYNVVWLADNFYKYLLIKWLADIIPVNLVNIK